VKSRETDREETGIQKDKRRERERAKEREREKRVEREKEKETLPFHNTQLLFIILRIEQ
jgi:hypothetical protein